MIKFQIGDQVRLIGAPASEWHGVVVNTIERPGDFGKDPVQECAVQTFSNRRWFLATHLVRTVPDRTLRFFRGELLSRWTDLSHDEVMTLNGNREELIAFLQERYGFGVKRATVETDDLLSHIEKRVSAAIQPSTDSLKLSA